ncbi:peptidase [Streptomyces sp. ms191]|uniref:peptidase n=1 Tax=Streptomyces sp. ms191 TaxID=1827978 RepID=UPI0011CED183|nr:peptidase [Streptomyces sp. ms191]TXS33971.1 peptidase [Streptomyces sp. ms191]
MKIRRILATAVAAAVTTPVVLLSAAPAFADTKPAAQTRNQKPTIEQLKLAVAVAQKAYDASVIAESEAQKTFEALLKTLETGGTHPAAIAYDAAKKAAEKAAEDKTKADQAVVDAQAKLDAAVTDEEKAAAQLVLDEAKATAQTAATAKVTADATVAAANTAVHDARVAGSQELARVQKAKEDARKALDEARKALADAEEGAGECLEDRAFTAVLTGPEKVVAGTSAYYTLKVTNGTKKVADEAIVDAFVTGFDNKTFGPLDKYLDLKWSTAASPKWQSIDESEGINLGTLKPGTRTDLKFKLTVDAKAPAGEGLLFAIGAYDDADGSCGVSAPAIFEFDIAAKPKKPTPGTSGGGNTNTTGQGGTSTTPVDGTGTTGTTGSLARTGSNDAVPQIALTGAAAVALGAGAMFVVRRRKAGSQA